MSLNVSIAAPRSSSPPVKLYKHRIDVTEGSGTSYGELPADIAMSYKPIAPAPTGSNHTPPGLKVISLRCQGVKTRGQLWKDSSAATNHMTRRSRFRAKREGCICLRKNNFSLLNWPRDTELFSSNSSNAPVSPSEPGPSAVMITTAHHNADHTASSIWQQYRKVQNQTVFSLLWDALIPFWILWVQFEYLHLSTLEYLIM